ncbi:MAG: 16S rRNA (adenine(1518)-N(6)/adenine(1519)-N(6))-dimethyltransferase RsmA [Verrucomicrobiota bacterium]
MRSLLESRGIQLTKSLGQNFLHDGNQLRRIVTAADLKPTDRVLEVGPGLGPLTELLLARAASVLAIEKDARLVAVLRERFAGALSGAGPGSLELLEADALRWVEENRRDWSDWKLVANLPYSVASPLMVELAEAPIPPQRMVVTLQAEVVQRIAAPTDGDDYGILTLLLGLRYQVREWFRIRRGCFHPIPDVDSACISLVRRPVPLLDEEGSKVFTRLVKRAFSERRKMMLKLLKTLWPPELLQDAFQQVGIQPSERAEKVSLEGFVALARCLGAPSKGVGPHY